MTISGPEMFLAVCFLLVTTTVFAFSAYLLGHIQKLRSEVHSLRVEVNTGDTE